MVICYACSVELFLTKVLILPFTYCTNISRSFIVPTTPSNLGINFLTLSMSALVYVCSWIEGKLFSGPWSKTSDTLYMQLSGWSRTILLMFCQHRAFLPSILSAVSKIHRTKITVQVTESKLYLSSKYFVSSFYYNTITDLSCNICRKAFLNVLWLW